MTILTDWQQLKNHISLQEDAQLGTLIEDIEFQLEMIANNVANALAFPETDTDLLGNSLVRIEETFGIKGEEDDGNDE